jgi:hypothetical protein
MDRPYIAYGDEVREMNDEEYADYLQMQADSPPPLEPTDETPSPD